MSLEPLAVRARRVRALFAALERARDGRPWTRADLAQGFVGDVGNLIKLLMAKDGRRKISGLEAKLAHEFGDCLWSLLVLAEASGVDLEKAFHATMDELEAKLQPRARRSKGRAGLRPVASGPRRRSKSRNR